MSSTKTMHYAKWFWRNSVYDDLLCWQRVMTQWSESSNSNGRSHSEGTRTGQESGEQAPCLLPLVRVQLGRRCRIVPQIRHFLQTRQIMYVCLFHSGSNPPPLQSMLTLFQGTRRPHSSSNPLNVTWRFWLLLWPSFFGL